MKKKRKGDAGKHHPNIITRARLFEAANIQIFALAQPEPQNFVKNNIFLQGHPQQITPTNDQNPQTETPQARPNRAPLGIIANKAANPETQQLSQRHFTLKKRLYKTQKVAKRWLRGTGIRTATCGNPLKGVRQIPIILTDEGRYTFGSLETCSSVWNCPVCSTKIQAHRREILGQIVENMKGNDYKASFLTLTTRHHMGDNTIKMINQLWRFFTTHRNFKDIRKAQLLEYVRVVENTYSEKKGFHTHLHCILFTSNPLTPEQVSTLHELWNHGARSKFGIELNQHGFDLEPVRENSDKLQEYLTKWSIIKEISPGPGKKGRGKNRTMFELLSDNIETESERDKAAFIRYAKMFKGHRQITMTRGITELTGIELTTDEEANAATIDSIIFTISTQQYWHLDKLDLLVDLLYKYHKTKDPDKVRAWIQTTMKARI